MKLLKAAGIKYSVEDTEDVRRLLIEAAYSFLASGGVLTLSDWSELSPQERAAFLMAGKRLWTERIALIGCASQGPIQSATVFADVDGGKARDQMILDAYAEKIAEKMIESKPVPLEES